MALNPLRPPAPRGPAEAAARPSPFQVEADAGLDGFRSVRDDLVRQVRRGDLTPKVARQRAAEAAAALKADLLARGAGVRPGPGLFQERLVLAADARKATGASASLEALQRESIRLLRLNLIEQQLANRAVEFEGRTFVRPLTGGQAAPTLNSLLDLHEQAERSGDEAAREWARRQLEGMRPRVLEPDDQRRIDAACDRPDRVNPRVVARYLEALRDAGAEDLEIYVARALEGRDAGACCAAFVLAREAPEGPAARWVRAVLEGLKDYPDAALEHLRAWEAELQREAAEAARAAAEDVAARAEFEARLPGLEAPGADDLERQSRIGARPVAAPSEPIGLALHRRGLTPEEFAALETQQAPPPEVG